MSEGADGFAPLSSQGSLILSDDHNLLFAVNAGSGSASEILFILVLGLLVLEPKRLHTMVGHVARARVRFEEASRGFKSQLAAELNAKHDGANGDEAQDL
jgi:Sec-independent protein translocase protein TatA